MKLFNWTIIEKFSSKMYEKFNARIPTWLYWCKLENGQTEKKLIKNCVLSERTMDRWMKAFEGVHKAVTPRMIEEVINLFYIIHWISICSRWIPKLITEQKRIEIAILPIFDGDFQKRITEDETGFEYLISWDQVTSSHRLLDRKNSKRMFCLLLYWRRYLKDNLLLLYTQYYQKFSQTWWHCLGYDSSSWSHRTAVVNHN